MSGVDREGLREALIEGMAAVWWQKTPRGKDRTATRDELADALLDGPLAPLLAAVGRVETCKRLVAFYDRHEYSSLNVDDLRAALTGPTEES